MDELKCDLEPPNFCPEGTYLPNFCDCTSYYVCSEGNVAEVSSCPPGTAFDAATSGCVDIDEVDSCRTIPEPFVSPLVKQFTLYLVYNKQL